MGIAALDVGQHVVDVLLGDALVAHGAAGQRAGHDETHVADQREIAQVFGVGHAVAGGRPEHLPQVQAVVGSSDAG